MIEDKVPSECIYSFLGTKLTSKTDLTKLSDIPMYSFNCFFVFDLSIFTNSFVFSTLHIGSVSAIPSIDDNDVISKLRLRVLAGDNIIINPLFAAEVVFDVIVIDRLVVVVMELNIGNRSKMMMHLFELCFIVYIVVIQCCADE